MFFHYRFHPGDYPIEDCDKKARLQRALEIAEGVDPPAGFTPSEDSVVNMNSSTVDDNKKPDELSSKQQQQHAIEMLLRMNAWHSLSHSEDIPRIHSQVLYTYNKIQLFTQ